MIFVPFFQTVFTLMRKKRPDGETSVLRISQIHRLTSLDYEFIQGGWLAKMFNIIKSKTS